MLRSLVVSGQSQVDGRACRSWCWGAGTVPGVWSLPCRTAPSTVGCALAIVSATLTGCGSGDSTVAKTPNAKPPSAAPAPTNAAGPPATVAPPASSTPPDPCSVNLAAPTIAKAVSELPRDPRSQQPWNPEPLAGNYNECAQLSAVIIKANTNAGSPTTRAVLFHLGQYIPQGVPDTYGFNGIDAAQSTGDTVALTYASAIGGLGVPVKFRWNGGGVEIIASSRG